MLIQRDRKTLSPLSNDPYLFKDESHSPKDHPRMLCDRLVEIDPFGSGGGDFQLSAMDFPYFVIISPGKKRLTLNLNKLEFSASNMYKSGWNCGVLLEKTNYRLRLWIFAIFLLSPLGKGCVPLFEENLNPPSSKNVCAKFGWKHSCGSVEDKNVKSCSVYKQFISLPNW